MLESLIQSKIKSHLSKKGWIVQKFNPATNGWPDLICLKNSRCFFIETKQPRKDLRPLQEARKRILEEQGFSVYRCNCINDLNYICEL